MAGQNRSGSRKQSGKVAFCGMMVALSVALMLTGGLVPIATYCAPMLGGILLLPIMLEYGRKTAWTAYIATSLIVLTLGVDKEAARRSGKSLCGSRSSSSFSTPRFS